MMSYPGYFSSWQHLWIPCPCAYQMHIVCSSMPNTSCCVAVAALLAVAPSDVNYSINGKLPCPQGGNQLQQPGKADHMPTNDAPAQLRWATSIVTYIQCGPQRDTHLYNAPDHKRLCLAVQTHRAPIYTLSVLFLGPYFRKSHSQLFSSRIFETVSAGRQHLGSAALQPGSC